MVFSIVRRLFQAVLVMLVVGFIAFTMFNFLGDPVANMVGSDVTMQEREQIRAALGLNEPIHIQFVRFVWNVLHGEFGVSYRLGLPVDQLIGERLPATLELSLCAAVLALVVGLPMGIYTGLHRNSWVSRFMLAGSLIGVSLPTFLIGILLILVFSVVLGVLPSSGRGDVVDLGGWTTGFLTVSGWKALILPSITLTFFQTTLLMRLVRAEMLEVLRTDFIKFARARGLTDTAIHFGHALKNTLVPVITITGLQLGSIMAFSIITETVFQWPGMGLLFIQAVHFADVPVLASYLILIGLFFVAVNLIVDVLYLLVDPRLRTDPTV